MSLQRPSDLDFFEEDVINRATKAVEAWLRSVDPLRPKYFAVLRGIKMPPDQLPVSIEGLIKMKRGINHKGVQDKLQIMIDMLLALWELFQPGPRVIFDPMKKPRTAEEWVEHERDKVEVLVE